MSVPAPKIVPEQKTVIIWDSVDYGISFLVVSGDRRHLDGTYLNTGTVLSKEKENELEELVVDEGRMRKMGEDFPTTAVLEGAFVIVCGILP